MVLGSFLDGLQRVADQSGFRFVDPDEPGEEALEDELLIEDDEGDEIVCIEAYPSAGPYAGKYHKTTCPGCLDLSNKTPHVGNMTCARFRRNLSQRRSNAKAATKVAADMRERMLRSRRPPIFDEYPGGAEWCRTLWRFRVIVSVQWSCRRRQQSRIPARRR